MYIYIYMYICRHILSGGEDVRALQFEKLFQLLIFIRYEMSWAFIELGVWPEERSQGCRENGEGLRGHQDSLRVANGNLASPSL